MKKILSFLTILVLLGFFAPQVFGADGYVTDVNNNKIYYRLANGVAIITYPGNASYPWPNNYSSNRPIRSVIIPGRITHSGRVYDVIAIDPRAFHWCVNITSVTIPNSVTSIGSHAFWGCSGLTSITLPNSVTTIGNAAFYGCASLTSLTIPSSVTTIDNAAFYGCASLTSVIIPTTVTSFGDSVFAECTGLSSVSIPTTFTSIRDYTFYQCSGLTSVTIPNSVTSIGIRAFYYCSGLTSVTIPNSVTSIGGGAFDGCSRLRTLTIPNSVTSIGDYAFRGCSGLTGSLSIPNSVTYIGSFAFDGCSGLTGSLTIPNSVTSIGRFAFHGCSGLTGSLTIGRGVTYIGYGAFGLCGGLRTIYFNAVNCSSDYSNISGSAGVFLGGPQYGVNGVIVADTNITSISFGNNVTAIPDALCKGLSGLRSITIPSSCTSIGRAAFEDCTGITTIRYNATRCTIVGGYYGGGSSRTYIPAFSNCPASLIIGDNVTYIPDSAFYGCAGLTSVTIGRGVTSIGYDAFKTCTGLRQIFFNADGSCRIITANNPSSPSDVRSPFPNISQLSIVIGNNVNAIPASLCYRLTYIRSINIPNSVTSIGYDAFYSCSGLTSVTIPNSVDSIGSRAFYGCSGISSLNIGSNVNYIGNFAFNDCRGIRQIRCFPQVAPIVCTDAINRVGVFYGVPSNATVYIPCGSRSSYSSNGWSYFFSNLIESPGFVLVAQSNNSTQGSAQVFSYPSCTNSSATVSATANSGYVFDHWSDGSTSNPYTLTVTSDSTLTAYFAAAATVTVLSDNTTMGTVSGGGSYAVGRTATLTATPNHGYFFTQWRDGSTQNPRTVTVTADTTFIAFFAPYSYPINVVSANDTMGSVRGSGTYNYGTTVTIAATANSGYRFARWHDGITSATRSVVVTDSATYTAYFELDQYTITAVSGNSTMGSVSGGGNYAAGSTATLTATANNGYHFRYWQDRDTTNPRTVTVVGDATYTAFFAPNSYTVTAVPNDAAWGSIRGGGTYDYGATATLTANANSGYHFDHWSDSTTANPYALTVTGDVNLIAYFVSDGGSNGISDIEASDISVYAAEGRICVTLDGQTTDEFSVYDVMGRRAAHVIASDKSPVLPNGVYIVKVGTHPARKVVVIR